MSAQAKQISARRRSRLLRTTAVIPAAAIAGTSTAFSQAVNLGQNATTSAGKAGVAIHGSITSARRATFSGGTAYATVSSFNDPAGSTVNLRVPKRANELVVVVQNGAVNIQGTVNTYKNGKIGGSVVFVDPNGLVIGSTGSVNTGSLSVVTPSGATLSQLVNTHGRVNKALAAKVLTGNVPLSTDGSVVIQGGVNALHAVRVTPQSVRVAGSLVEAQRMAMQRAQFESTVNVQGLQESGRLVAGNGTIRLVGSGATPGAYRSDAVGNSVASASHRANGSATTHVQVSSGVRQARSSTSYVADANVPAATSGRQTARRQTSQTTSSNTEAGSISIDAGSQVVISGLLIAGSSTTQAGSIDITGADISISGTARLIAEGTGSANGGTISIKASGTTTVAAGATFNVAALGSGNGGLVEISGAVDQVAAAINVNVGAASGKAGTLLFDPDQLIIGGTTSTAYGDQALISSAGSLYTNGGSVELDATTSIEIAGTIDTRKYDGDGASATRIAGLLAANNTASRGDSGSITLKAPSITVDAGGALYADVGGTSHKAGDVTLVASTTDSETVGASAASTGITINGTVTGANISATAIATASSSIETLAGFVQLPVNTLAGSFVGLDGSYVGSSATAKVTLQGQANLQASGSVSLVSVGSETAVDPIITIASVIPQNPVAAGVVVGKISGTVTTEVQSGATISAGGAVTVAAANNATMSVNAQTITFAGSSLDATVAYSTGSVTTSALIDTGAVISKAPSLAVTSQNTNSFSTGSSSLAGGSAQAGVAVAISDVSTSSAASLGASLASGAGVGNISVYSGSNTTANVVQASTTVGSNFLTVGFSSAAQTLFAPVTTFFGSGSALGSTGAGSAMAAQGTGTFVPKGGVALSLNLSQQESAASIAATGNAAAPTITSSGDVAVVSRLTDAGIRSDAEATINSNSYNPTTNDPGASSSLALAVSVAQITHESDASIGANVILTAAHVGVDAELSVPITNNWTNYATFGAVTQNLEQLASQLNGNGGVVNDILSSYANATSSSSNLGLAGAVDYFAITNTTTASIGAGAQVTQTSASPTWSSSISVANGVDGSNNVQYGTPTVGWTAGVAVTASASNQSIDVGGNFSWLLVLGGSNSTSPLGTAVGGSANVDILSDTTKATIGSAAVVTASGNLDVSATTSDLVYGVAPTSGLGSGFGGNGIASVIQIDNTTAASISNTAVIKAPSVSVDAEQDLSGFAVAGAVGASSGSGVGIAVALEDIKTNTSAFIGDSALNASQGGTPGGIDTNSLSLAALTTGRLTTVSVAAEYSNGTPPVAAPASVAATSPSPQKYFPFVSEFLANGSALVTKLGSAIDTAGAANTNAGAGTSSVAGAGSSSVALTSIQTSASLEDGKVMPYSAGGTGNSVSVQALHNMIIDTASGAAAIAKGAPLGSYTVGIAGAVAVAIDADDTAAAIGAGSTIKADTVAVQALSGGQNTSVGLAVALTAGTGVSDSTAVSASVSVTQVNDGVNASIDSSSLTGTTAGNTGAVSVSAVDDTAIGIGAGSLAVQGAFFGNGSSIGIALTYAGINDPASSAGVSAIVSNSTLSQYGALTVAALDQDRIISGAAVASGGATSNGFEGAVVINQIAPTVLAEITGTPAVSGTTKIVGGITVTGDVNVTSTGGSDATLDALISTARIASTGGLASSGGGTGADDSHLDFTASALSPTHSAGAGIFAVAGQIGVGKSNVGISLVVDQIAQSNYAVVDGVTLTSTTGVVNVAARNDADIVGVAFGVSGAYGSAAGVGSVVYNSIADGVVAQIGHETATDASLPPTNVTAAAVEVTAEDGSSIRGATGGIALNVGGGNAVGLSATIDQISNYVVAEVASANVAANESLGDGSQLVTGPLSQGSVVVSATSIATIETIAIGAAASVGNPGATAPATPQQNFASLVSGLQPAAPTQLAGRFGPGAFFVNYTPKSPPPTPPTNGLSGAGSIAISTESTSVTADVTSGTNSSGLITTGSSVTANNNAVILASNTDSISGYAGALSVSVGSGRGIGISVVVNEIEGGTSAFVNDSTINASGSGAAVTLDSGTLATPVDPSKSQTPASNPDLSDGQVRLNGIAILATSQQMANTVAVVASLSTAASSFGANSETNVMGGTTQAYAQSAALDGTAGVRVAASSASFANNLDIGAAASSSAGAGTIALVINTMNRTTSAYTNATSIGTSGAPAAAVTIFANAWEGTSGEAIGIAASGASGVAGSALVNTFAATTSAYQLGGTIDAGSLTVKAATIDGDFGAIGTAALGSSAGVGASVMVSIINNNTNATIGDTTNAVGTTDNLTGALTVAAATTGNVQSYEIGAAIGGTAGVSAMATVDLVTNQTAAQIADTFVTIPSSVGASSGGVSVTATENATINATSGGVAAGGSAGAGASVNVAILTSSDAASITGSTISTPGAVDVMATSTRDVGLITVTAGLGAQAGLAGTVGVILIGSAASSDQDGLIGSTVASADSATASNGTLTTALRGGVDGISASIVGGSVTASSVDIQATGNVGASNISGALGFGLAGGFGAAIAYTDVDQTITAKATGGSVQTGALTIDATAGNDNTIDASKTFGVAGAGGAYIGLGAAVAISNINNSVTAELGSHVDGGSTNGSVVVEASDTSIIDAEGYGFAGGFAAIGVSVGTAEKTSTVNAQVNSNTTIANMGAVLVDAAASGSVTSYTIAGAAGVASGAGTDATSEDTETVTASIGSSSNVTANTSGTLVSASATPNVSASAIGVAVGAAAGVGVSVAQSTASVNVTAYVGDNSTIWGGGLTIGAIATTPSSGSTAYAKAVAGGGGLLLGASATDAESKDTSQVSAYGGNGLTLPSANVTIGAENDSYQDAEGTGIAVGYIGAGDTVAKATSSTTTIAYLGSAATTSASNTGALAITATGNDDNVANAVAGSGGIFAGAGAEATTSTSATTTATLKGGSASDTLYFGSLGILANHSTTFSAEGDAYQASAVGASGGSATNTVSSTVTAEVGPHLIVNSAGGDMDVMANDNVLEMSGGSRGGSGGVAAGAATLSGSTVTQNVTTKIDTGTIFSLNDDPLTSTAKIDIEAYNSLSTSDTVNLTAAGLFAGGGAQSNLSATANVNVTIADNVVLFSAGYIDVGTASRMSSDNNANANLYGLATGAGASTDSELTANQTVTIGAAKLEAWGIISIYAGQSGNGSYTSDVEANATTTVYNQALIPITATYRGNADAYDYTSLTLGTGSQVLGANNIFLGATRGTVTAAGNGTNYNPYLEAFSTDKTDNNANNPATNGSGSVALNGVVAAGIHNQETVTIAYDGTVTLTKGGSYDDLTLQLVSDPSQFTSVVTYRSQTLQYASFGGFNPYVQVVQELASLSGLSNGQVETALQSGAQINAINDNTAGDKQREIQTLVQQAAFATNAAGPTIALSPILVSGGNVTIQAETLSGAIANGKTPTVTAHGSPLIDIEDQTIQFLDISSLSVSGNSGGQINFTGSATGNSVVSSATQGIGFSSVTSATPSIIVNASYNVTNSSGQGVDANGNVLTTTPDLYFNGAVTNLNGSLSITDQLGNVTATQSYDAATVQLLVPKGSFTFDGGANSIYSTGGDVASEWASVENRPTGVTTVVDAAATYLGTYGNLGANGFNPYYYYWDASANKAVYDPVTNYGSSASTVFTARLLNLYYSANGSQLYSSIFLPMGYPNNDTSKTPVGNATWNNGQYRGQAYSTNDSSGPFNCSGCAGFFTVINLQPLSATASSVANSAAASINAGKAVILSAAYLNINGAITSGQSNNYSVSVGQSAQNYIAGILGNAQTLAEDKQSAASGHYVDLSPYITTTGSGDVQIAAQYDALTNQIVLNNVVQGSTGYVYLNGKILSTSTAGVTNTTAAGQQLGLGSITVNGGAGTVTINNTTGTELVTNTINTGVSAASVVEIVDQNTQNTTWYAYNPTAGSNAVSVYSKAGVTNGAYQTGSLVGTGGATGLAYSPMANQLYQWTDKTTVSHPDVASPGNSNIGDPTSLNWTFNTAADGSPNSGTYPYVRSTTITTGSQASNYQQTVTATGTSHEYNGLNTGSHKCCGTNENTQWYQTIYDSLTLSVTNSVKADYAIGINFNGGATSDVSITSNASVVINGSINNALGSTTITTSGANSAILAGAAPFVSGQNVTLTAPGGIGKIDAAIGAIPVQLYGGVLTATSVDNDIAIAGTGSLSISQISVLSANGTTPQGNVYLSATGDINASSSYNVNRPVIVGKSIEIDSSGGAIGAVSTVDNVTGLATLNNINPLVIQATPTLLSNGSYDGGLLNSTQSKGAYIAQSSGDLRLGSVSSSGPVFLESATGSILNGVTTGGLTTAQAARLASIWASLDLVTGSGTAAVQSYQSVIDAAYNDYFQLQNLAFSNGSTYSITPQGSAVIAAQIAAQTGVSANAVSATQIQTEVTNRYLKDEYLLGLVTTAQLGVPLDTLFGTPAGQTAQFQPAVATSALTNALQTYSSSFSYKLPTTSALYTSLTTGSQWTLDELTYTVSKSADPASNTPAPSIASLPLNVSGRQIILYAPQGSIGSLAPSQSFSFTSADDSSLTSTDKALLASAGPGQLQVTSTALSGGVTQYNVTVTEQSLVIVNPLASVAADAQSQIYLGSAGNLLLGGINPSLYGPLFPGAYLSSVQANSGGNVKLEAVDSILSGVANQVAISGNIADLTLIAETGSIGTAAPAGTNPASNPNALVLSLSGRTVGQLDQANAADGIYLRQSTGDLILGNINGGSGASGVVQLTASGAIYAEPQFTNRTVPHIIASALDLRAAEISFNGSTYQPLQVEVSGAVTGSITGNATILSPAGNLTVGVAGQSYGGLTSGGTLILDATGGALTVNGDVSGTNNLQLLANEGVTLAAGTSSAPVIASSSSGPVAVDAATLTMGAQSSIDAAGVISISTTGNATLGQLDSSLAGATTAAVSVTAGGPASIGAILTNGDGRDNVVATSTGAAITLTASGGIGSSTQPLAVNAAGALSISTSGGNDYVSSINALHVTTATASLGSLTITSPAALQVDSVATGTTLNVTSTGASVTLGSATSGGTQTITAAGGNLSYATLTTNGIVGDAGSIDLSASSAVRGAGGLLGGSLISANGNVGITGATVTLDTVTAKGFATIGATTTLAGTSLTTGGDASLAAGVPTNLSPSLPVTLAWTTVNAGTTFEAEAYGGSITSLGSVTSGVAGTSPGTQTIGATDAISYTTLLAKSGDIDVIGATIAGTTLTAKTGAALLTSTGADGANTPSIDVASVSTGTQFGATAQTGGIMLGMATSGATQTIQANQAVNYKTLKTTAGDIDVTSNRGSITGTPNATDTLEAYGAFDLQGATTISATSLKADNGAGTVNTSGAVTLGTTTTGTTLGVTSTGASVALGSATSGGTQTIGAKTAVDFTSLTANGGDVDATAATVAGTTLTAKTGAALLTSTGADGANTPSIDVASVSTGTTFGATAQAGSIMLGVATSGGTQTIQANQAVNYTTLKTTAGDIDVTSQTASITGGPGATDTLEAKGSFDLQAVTTISANALTAGTGAGTVSTGGAITLATVSTPEGALGVTSTGSSVTLATAASGGTETISAKTAIGYTSLKTTAGDIDLTSGGSIAGWAGSNVLEAHGSFDLQGTTTITANALTADTGTGLAQTGGAITLATMSTPQGVLGVTSTNSTVTLGTATSGGTQTIGAAGGIGYTTLKTTAGDIDVTSTGGSITGEPNAIDTLEANGAFNLQGKTTISATSLKADNGAGTVNTAGAVTLGTTMTGTTLGVTSTSSTVTLGAATSGGTQTIQGNQAVNYTALKTTAGDIDVTSTGGSITGSPNAIDTLEANGAFNLQGATTVSATSLKADNGAGTVNTAGAVTLGTTMTGTTLGVTSTGSTVTLGTATSGGTQTIEAGQAINYTTLKTTAGDIDVTSTGGSITGAPNAIDTLEAYGAFDLQGATTVSATSMKADIGTGTLNAGRTIALASISTPHGALDVTSTDGSITLGAATSGGTQTVKAAENVTFSTLTTTAGDINVTASSGTIAGTILAAHGSTVLAAYGDNTGTSLTTTLGSATLTSQVGDIDWSNLDVATSLAARATAGGIAFGTAASGGSQTLTAFKEITFAQLTASGMANDPGNVTLTAITGPVHGGSIDANGFVSLNGVGIDFNTIHAVVGATLISGAEIQGQTLTTRGVAVLDAATTLGLGTLEAASVSLSAAASIAMTNITVDTSIDFATQNLSVADLRQAPGVAGPLYMTLTGYAGGVGQNAILFVDAPNGLVIPVLREDPVTITTTARQVTVDDALLTGTMQLTTPTSNLWFNDVSSRPINGHDVQFFAPGDQFYLVQNGNSTTTNSYIVQYGPNAVIHEDINGVIYNGASLVRDIDRQGRVGQDDLIPSFDDDDPQSTLWHFPVERFDRHLARLRKQVLGPVDGTPAVNLGIEGRSSSDAFTVLFRRQPSP